MSVAGKITKRKEKKKRGKEGARREEEEVVFKYSNLNFVDLYF